MNRDIVYINELEAETVIGIYDWERKIRQKVVLDLEMQSDIYKGSVTDNIEDALDYKAVSKRLAAFIEDSEFFLVETLAENISNILLNEFEIPWFKLKLSKPGAVSNAKDVGVIIERSRTGLGS